MARITRYLSSRVNSSNTCEIYLRVTVTHSLQFRLRSGLCVRPERFKRGGFVMPRTNQREINEIRELETRLQRLEALIIDFCIARGNEVTKVSLEGIVSRFHNPNMDDAAGGAGRDFYEIFDEFTSMHNASRRNLTYQSIARALYRYEVHRRLTQEPGYKITLDGLTADDIADFKSFFCNEWRYYEEYPQVYMDYPASLRSRYVDCKPERRGDNTILSVLKCIKAFYNWCNKQELTENRPFYKYVETKIERYGTPYYLTIEERDRIADFDLSSEPSLAVQRDIFVFQCLIGARVSDLKRLEKSNVIGDMIEYIPKKTRKENNRVVRVPLCERALQIIGRYTDRKDNRLLPFINEVCYNRAIKSICRVCGIDRCVTVINSVTGEDEQRPIYEIASSHMARRTFIGNLYKHVKDPNLIGSLSGHKEGSRAFVRYRDIDDDMRRDLIDFIK